MKQVVTLLVGPQSSTNLTGGMRIAFDLLISGLIEKKIPYQVVNRAKWTDKTNRKVGEFSFKKGFFTLGLLLSFYKQLFQVDIIYIALGTSRSGFFRDLLMIFPGWLLHKRLVIHLHGGGMLNFYKAQPRWLQFLMRHTYAKVNVIIVLGELLRNQFEFVPGFDQKTRIVPNGLSSELNTNYNKPKKLVQGEPLRLLYLSNLIPSKGYLDVLETCRLLWVERQIPVTCDFCGAFVEMLDDEYSGTPAEAEAHFREKIKTDGLVDVVSYHGTVQGKQKQQFLEQAHLFIIPTFHPWEGQLISIIEAMAFATPVITTCHGGIPEQVLDGYNGFWVAPQSPVEIADAVEKFWRNPELYSEFSRNARQHFLEHFTQEAHLNRLIPIILNQQKIFH